MQHQSLLWNGHERLSAQRLSTGNSSALPASRTTSTLRGLGSLCLLALLTGCAQPQVLVERVAYPVPQYIPVPVPLALLEPCPEPDILAIRTNEDLEAALAEALAYLERCTLDKQAIAQEQEKWQPTE
jgi:hypothetical protein